MVQIKLFLELASHLVVQSHTTAFVIHFYLSLVCLFCAIFFNGHGLLNRKQKKGVPFCVLTMNIEKQMIEEQNEEARS
ncbi:hypothetical protein NQ315_001716 [Exocentrus adspersus]|uniref:Uncharacterized protein n=1 Tax=Exocentrus adspersus TaxID=1586481 RepID=A0AAV8W900_9CUCU|nr:hypothetical protein NQ315_001716 [Exocentrus adspersus]